MKLKGMIAAALCGILLTGCQADARPQNSEASSTKSTSAATQTTPETITTKATTQQTTVQTTTTRQTTTTAPQVKFEKLTITGVRVDPANNDYADISIIPVQKDYPAGTEIEIYHGTTADNMTFDCVDYYKRDVITASCVPGMNYYKIRLTNYVDLPGEFSEIWYVERQAEIHQYTHTFETNQTGWSIVPDYSLAIEDINNGIQPTKFEVTAQWTCPICGWKKMAMKYPLSYCEGGKLWLYETTCGVASCSNRRGDHCYKNYLTWYAIQTS